MSIFYFGNVSQVNVAWGGRVRTLCAHVPVEAIELTYAAISRSSIAIWAVETTINQIGRSDGSGSDRGGSGHQNSRE
ncbi:hypothetical protein E4U23_000134 [Claviceps purpurea]|nr:hypothetical protein E4U23_000134 [Claviceps purpurea]